MLSFLLHIKSFTLLFYSSYTESYKIMICFASIIKGITMFKKDPMLLFDEMAPSASQVPAPQPDFAQPGMLDTVKEKLNVNNIMEKIKSSKDQLFEIGLYAGAGFLSGFLLKKYSSYVVVLVLLLVGLGVLNQMEVINLTVNW